MSTARQEEGPGSQYLLNELAITLLLIAKQKEVARERETVLSSEPQWMSKPNVFPYVKS